MAERINVNVTAVNNISKKLKMLNEEVIAYLQEADRAINSAESDGWNDHKYHEFKDNFFDTKSLYLQACKRIEEEHLPVLQRIARLTAEF